MAWTLDKVEAAAPDQASLAAARKLLKPTLWPTLAQAEGMAWGECQGSGATPYRVVISESDAGYKCTCPSRKFPCKHSLALMWMRAEGKPVFAPAPVPEWVKDYLARKRTNAPRATPDADDKPRPSLALVEDADALEADPKSAERAAAARERNRLDREASIAAGLDELDTWLADQVERGMAAFVPVCGAACRTLAQRMVDAKASGLAARLEALPARLFTLPESARPTAAIEELGQLYLIAQAYRRQEVLPPGLRADARQALGWTTTRDSLLADPTALRITATWRVIATRTEAQPDRLRRIETWFLQENSPTFALLLDFVPLAGAATASGYVPGDRLHAELAFYPSACPLRAQIVRFEAGATACPDPMPIPAQTLAESLARMQAAMARLPWLGTWPITFAGARIRRTTDTLFLIDDRTSTALPLLPDQTESTLSLAALDDITGMGLWNGDHLTLCWAETALGPWRSA